MDATQRFVAEYKAKGNKFTFELDPESVHELHEHLEEVALGEARYAELTANLRFVG